MQSADPKRDVTLSLLLGLAQLRKGRSASAERTLMAGLRRLGISAGTTAEDAFRAADALTNAKAVKT